jgi:hypothetical protein
MTLAHDLATLPARVKALAEHYATAQARLREEIELCDGFPTSVIGAGEPTAVYSDKVRADADVRLNSVEAAAVRVGPLMTEALNMRRLASELLRYTLALEVAVNRRLPKADHAAGEACARGVGREGVIEWGDPLCVRIREADRGGMCGACAKREYRWRMAHEMAPRERDAA